MKKHKLLNYIDDGLLDKLFGFCYARTSDSYEAQDLCSDIIFALVKAAHTDGEIANVYPFIWRTAQNVYADFSKSRRRRADTFYEGSPEDVLAYIAAPEEDDGSADLLRAVYRRIAFLTKAYREVIIMFYLDGCSTAEIAKRQDTSEGAVRQRLFSARKKVKSEVEKMNETYNRPVALDTKLNYIIWGTGNPNWSDPRNVCTRMFSRHIIWLCHKKPMTAPEIAEELNVPTVYVEEELEILAKGEYGKYGLLRRLDNGRYSLNFILFDVDVIEKANAIYTEQVPKICGILSGYIEDHREEYLAYPYLNRKTDLNLVLWQQISILSGAFSHTVEKILEEEYFSQTEKPNRPFSVFGWVDHGKHYGGGWDGVSAENVCGFSKIRLENIYTTRIKAHFHCGLNVANDPLLQLALRAIDGLDASSLSELEKEHASKAIDCGYLYREGDTLYTKILVSRLKDRDGSYDISFDDGLFDISFGLYSGYFEEDARAAAGKLAALIRSAVPDYLLGEWRLAVRLAGAPVLDSVIEFMIGKGLLTPPQDGVGAEGCWMSVSK